MFERLTTAEEEVLLARPVRDLLTAATCEAFAGGRWLITGAGGSIGSELARRIAACRPAALTLVDHSELHLFEIERELRELTPEAPIDPVLADVSRRAPLESVVAAAQPDAVFHAAAYKHVTLAERAACAAAQVNVLGTALAHEAARRAGAAFVLISSDKAAAPRSVMGATKRLAEAVALRPDGPRAAVVRFGNVLCSSGSFVAVARDCLRRQRPIHVTDPDATRYFMTVGEAVALVMTAYVLSRGGETFWLDMGTPVRVGDLVERLMAASGRRVPVTTIGLRPGEKVVEQLVDATEEERPTSHPYIRQALRSRDTGVDVAAALDLLQAAVARGDTATVLRALAEAVPGYQPSALALAPARPPLRLIA